MNSKRIWYLLGGVLGVGIIVLGWFLGSAPSMSTAAQNDQTRAGVEGQNLAQQTALQTSKAQYARIDELRAQLATMQLSIPGAADVDDFFDQIAALASSAGASVTSISASEAQPYGASGATGSGGSTPTPTAPAPTSTASPSPSTSPTPGATPAPGSGTSPTAGGTAAAPSDLYMIPVTITLSSGRDSAVALVEALQSAGHRLMLVNTLTITSSPDAASIGGYVFVVHDVTAAAAAAGSTGRSTAAPSASPSASSTGTSAPPRSSSASPSPTPSR
jgi:hypothetical protein